MLQRPAAAGQGLFGAALAGGVGRNRRLARRQGRQQEKPRRARTPCCRFGQPRGALHVDGGEFPLVPCLEQPGAVNDRIGALDQALEAVPLLHRAGNGKRAHVLQVVGRATDQRPDLPAARKKVHCERAAQESTGAGQGDYSSHHKHRGKRRRRTGLC
jgi:hypothetical protein